MGHLVRAGGVWNSGQIVPRDWLKRAITPAVMIQDGRRYGYHWYLGASTAAASQRLELWVGGIGWGGQRLYVFRELDLVVAHYCGNYQKPINAASTVSCCLKWSCRASFRQNSRAPPCLARQAA